jgi:NAD(P)-dependent dehydrogenase (short-subunit alcohol dehydrogenase family)
LGFDWPRVVDLNRASKAAEWSLTKAVRFELRAQGTLVTGVYGGYIDTDRRSPIA